MKTLTKDITAKDTLTEREIILLKRRANKGEEVELREEYEITPEQTAKGLAYLLNQWRTPRGVERKHNPFGIREQDALNTFKSFTFDGFYDAGNGFVKWYMPIYTVIGKDTCFQYTMKDGGVYIIG
jgi:hypothetical protein